jgi:hypothetical protein
VRRVDGADLIESLLVAAISTVLIVRLYLASTGYPKIGGDGFHFAHVLWGGLLMLVAALVFLGLLGRWPLHVGSLAAGIGFGLFIDEVGKFVTADVDYFFRPALAIIYVVFVLLALLLVALRRTMRTGPREALANALALADEAISDPRAAETRLEVLSLLARADKSDPLVGALRERIVAAGLPIEARPGALHRARVRLAELYRRLALNPWFIRAIVGWFVFAVIISLVTVTYLALGEDVGPGADEGPVVHTLQLSSSLASAACVVVGIARLRRSRLAAYHWFQRANLISILVTHVFTFYDSQLAALTGLAVSLLIYVALRYAISQEEAQARRPETSPSASPVAA